MGWLVYDCNCGGWFVVIGGGWLCNAGYVVVGLCLHFRMFMLHLTLEKKQSLKGNMYEPFYLKRWAESLLN